MKQYHAKNILNIVIAGHSGSGGTTLAEALLFLSGSSDRLGKVGEESAVCDLDPEEIRREASVGVAVAPLEWKNHKINLIDTPGLFDFEGGLHEAVRAADPVLITVSDKSGVLVGTEKANQAAAACGFSKIFSVNGLCDESARFYHVFEDLEASFGSPVCPVVILYIVDGNADCHVSILEYKAYRYQSGTPVEVPIPDMGDRLDGSCTAICEAAAETSEEMFEKYFSGEQFTPEGAIVDVNKDVKNGTISPVFCGNAQLTYGIEQLLNGLIWLAPSAKGKSGKLGLDVDGNPVKLSTNEDGAAATVVSRTIADPFIGKLSYLKVTSGKVTAEAPLVNVRTGNPERIGKVVTIRGKEQEGAQTLVAGDIGAVPKLQGTGTGDTLCSPAREIVFEDVDHPAPILSMAIVPKNKGDEDKIVQGTLRLLEEDPTLRSVNDPETRQMIIIGLGEQHLDVVVSKLKSKFGVEITLADPRVPYRETIHKRMQVQGRHKKQTGGHGQLGDVWIEFEPCDSDDLELGERIIDGSVPKGFFPAVEKGLRESIQEGPLAGHPVVDLRATLYDGSYHPVDSSEMAFKLTANTTYKTGMSQAGPVLLEPIGTLSVTVPDSNTDDVMGEINKRRGRIMGMNPGASGMQMVEAEVPMVEMHDFTTFIRQVTQGRGSFTFTFTRYEEAPAQVAQKVVEAAKAASEKAE